MGGSPRLRRSDLPSIYAIADAQALGSVRLSDAVAEMSAAEITWVQLRAKFHGDAALCAEVAAIIAAGHGHLTLWINDRPDIAALYGAPGVHLGQDDLPPSAARKVVGEHCWIGQSTHDLDQLREADRDSDVDLIALGPVFGTSSKENPDPVVGLATLREARSLTAKPLVAIGGLEETNLAEVWDAGADSAVLLSAFCVGDIGANCRRIRALDLDRC